MCLGQPQLLGPVQLEPWPNIASQWRADSGLAQIRGSRPRPLSTGTKREEIAASLLIKINQRRERNS